MRITPLPADLQDRRVEITGPVDRERVTQALNSGARTLMADFEDTTGPTWENPVTGQRNLRGAVRGTIGVTQGGKNSRLEPNPAVLLVRPRGLHLPEKHLTVSRLAVRCSVSGCSPFTTWPSACGGEAVPTRISLNLNRIV